MECIICLEKFDTSIHKPLSLIRCAHSICNQCYIDLPLKSKCPSCNRLIEDAKTNWTLLNQLSVGSELNCLKCSENFDHSNKRPMSLLKCAHTLCNECLINLDIKKCPTCESKIEEATTNWSILNITPLSEYDKKKESFENRMKKIESDSIQFETNLKLEKIKKLPEWVKTTKEQVENQTNKLIKILNENKRKIFKDIDEKAKTIRNKISQAKIESIINDSRINLLNYNLGLVPIVQAQSKLNKLNFLEQFNENIQFDSNDNTKIDKNLIGKVKTGKIVDSYKNLVEKGQKAINLLEQDKNVKQADIKDSIAYFDKAIQSNPSIDIAYGEKGHLLYLVKDYITANESLSKAAEINPLDSNHHYRNGLCYFQIYESDDDQFFRRQVNDMIAKDREALIRNRTLDQAVICFDKAINLDQNNAELFSYKGKCLVGINKVEEAFVQFKRSTEIEPDNSYYKKLLNETQEKVDLLKRFRLEK